MSRTLQIGVMGPSRSSYPEDNLLVEKIERYAEEIGRNLAKKGVIVFTGGCDGVMESAMKGAKSARGITVGFPGIKRASSNKYSAIEILLDLDMGSFAFSGMLSCDSLITIPAKSAGTLAEVCLAYRHVIPNILLRGFDRMYDRHLIGNYLDNSKKIKLFGADNPEEAVDLAIKLAKEKLNQNGRVKEGI